MEMLENGNASEGQIDFLPQETQKPSSVICCSFCPME